MVQDGIKWYKMFHGGSRFQNSQRYLKHRKKYILHTYGLSAEGAKVLQKKKRTLDILPFSTVQSFSVLFSFLFVQIFPCGQVDSLFQIGHGATSPSLMVLFNARSNLIFGTSCPQQEQLVPQPDYPPAQDRITFLTFQ